MRWFTIVLIIFLIHLVYTSEAYRVPRPHVFSHPLDQEQIVQLNNTLGDLWNLTNGRFNLDIVTVSKTNASPGDIWLIQTGTTVKIQFRGIDRVFTVSNEDD